MTFTIPTRPKHARSAILSAKLVLLLQLSVHHVTPLKTEWLGSMQLGDKLASALLVSTQLSTELADSRTAMLIHSVRSVSKESTYASSVFRLRTEFFP